jgi:hypothetical protein
MSTRDELLAEVESFLTRSGMTPTRFGVEAMSDRTFVRNLRRSLDVRSSTIDRVRQFIRETDNRKRVA